VSVGTRVLPAAFFPGTSTLERSAPRPPTAATSSHLDSGSLLENGVPPECIHVCSKQFARQLAMHSAPERCPARTAPRIESTGRGFARIRHRLFPNPQSPSFLNIPRSKASRREL